MFWLWLALQTYHKADVICVQTVRVISRILSAKKRKASECEKEKIVPSVFMIACLSLSMKAQLILCIKSKLDLYLSLFAIQH